MATTLTSGPGALDWTVYAGDRNTEIFEFSAGSGSTPPPWDLTGAVITAQARGSAVDPVVALEAVCTITDAVGGLVSVAWDGELVREMLGGQDTWSGVWDLQLLETGQPLPLTLLRGAWKAIHDVTRVGP